MSATNYWLRRHVHVCSDADIMILLDLKNDQYLGFDRAQRDALIRLLDASAPALTAQPPDPLEDHVIDFAETLVKKGLLTRDQAKGKRASAIEIPFPSAALIRKDADDISSVDMRHILNFGVACASARFALRWRTLEHIVRKVGSRKTEGMKRSASLDPQALRSLVLAFHRIRPFFYSWGKKCLLDSLVLLEFLSAYDFFPNWVIGVQAKPFAAHSWVQDGNHVLNGGAEYVRRFRPIMVV